MAPAKRYKPAYLATIILSGVTPSTRAPRRAPPARCRTSATHFVKTLGSLLDGVSADMLTPPGVGGGTGCRVAVD